MTKERVRTILHLNTYKGRIPAGWEGEIQSKTKDIAGRKLLFVLLDANGEVVALREEEIEYV
jgi:hypothetical protein